MIQARVGRLLVVQGFCEEGQHNRMADILFKTGEGGLHAILHAPLGQFTSLRLKCAEMQTTVTLTFDFSIPKTVGSEPLSRDLTL